MYEESTLERATISARPALVRKPQRYGKMAHMQHISIRAGVPAIFRSISSRIASRNWAPISILLLACVLRVSVWWILPYRDVISDEGEYWAAAAWLAQGRGFSFFDNWIWTRPPLYIVFLAAHIRLFGITAMWAPRITQTILSLLLVFLVMRLAQKLSPPALRQRVLLIAGIAMACSYSFATFAYLLLSETLFCVLFILAFLVLLHWRSISQTTNSLSWKNRYQWIVLAGVLFGLSALT